MSDEDDFGADPLYRPSTLHYLDEPIPPGQHYLYVPPAQHNVGFGGGFTPSQLAVTGAISFGIAKVLGASVPGALVMGFGNMLWEAGSGNIPGGWRRYVLGLFRKPE
jgi:hypothetical protein